MVELKEALKGKGVISIDLSQGFARASVSQGGEDMSVQRFFGACLPDTTYGQNCLRRFFLDCAQTSGVQITTWNGVTHHTFYIRDKADIERLDTMVRETAEPDHRFVYHKCGVSILVPSK